MDRLNQLLASGGPMAGGSPGGGVSYTISKSQHAELDYLEEYYEANLK